MNYLSSYVECGWVEGGDAVIEGCRGGSGEHHPSWRSCAYVHVCLFFFFVSYILFFLLGWPGWSRHPTRRKSGQATSEGRCSSITSDSRLHFRLPCLLGESHPYPPLLVCLLYPHIVPESHSVVKEKRNLSLFPHHHRSESRTTAAIQQPAVKQEQQGQGVSAILPPKGSPLSKATGSPSKTEQFSFDLQKSGLSVTWKGSSAFANCLQRNPHPRGKVARSRRRPPPSSSSSTETSLPTRVLKAVSPNPMVFKHCSGPPRSNDRNGKRGRTTISARSRRGGEGTLLMVFLLGIWDWVGWWRMPGL